MPGYCFGRMNCRNDAILLALCPCLTYMYTHTRTRIHPHISLSVHVHVFYVFYAFWVLCSLFVSSLWISRWVSGVVHVGGDEVATQTYVGISGVSQARPLRRHSLLPHWGPPLLPRSWLRPIFCSTKWPSTYMFCRACCVHLAIF